MTKQQRNAEIAEARRTLDYLKPGDTVFTILRDVSRSGMSRQISVLTIRDVSGTPYAWHPNHAVATLLGARLNRSGARDAIIRTGCGYDAAADIVAHLGLALFNDAGALRHEAL